MKLKSWDELVKEFGLYKYHIDSPVLISPGLYEYVENNLDAVNQDKTLVGYEDDYIIYMAGIFWILPKEIFKED